MVREIKIDFQGSIEQMRRNFQKSNKKEFTKILARPLPPWIQADPFLNTFQELPKLIQDGNIYYAANVMAYDLLYDPFSSFADAPACFIYSTHGNFDMHPFRLCGIIDDLALHIEKDNTPNDLIPITNAIINPASRAFNLPFPNSWDVYYTSIYVFADFLPKRHIINQIVPIIANPGKYKCSTILPYKYWPREFIHFYNHKVSYVE